MATLCEMLQDIVDRVCNNTNNIKTITTPYTGVEAVSESDWTTLEPILNGVKDDIETIFSPINAPSYTPYDIGDESSYDPDGKATSTLGSDACARATAAYQRACVDDPPQQESSANYLRDVAVIIDALIEQADPG